MGMFLGVFFDLLTAKESPCPHEACLYGAGYLWCNAWQNCSGGGDPDCPSGEYDPCQEVQESTNALLKGQPDDKACPHEACLYGAGYLWCNAWNNCSGGGDPDCPSGEYDPCQEVEEGTNALLKGQPEDK